MRNMRKSSKMILRHKFPSEQSDNFLRRYYLGLQLVCTWCIKICGGSILLEDFVNANLWSDLQLNSKSSLPFLFRLSVFFFFFIHEDWQDCRELIDRVSRQTSRSIVFLSIFYWKITRVPFAQTFYSPWRRKINIPTQTRSLAKDNRHKAPASSA